MSRHVLNTSKDGDPTSAVPRLHHFQHNPNLTGHIHRASQHMESWLSTREGQRVREAKPAEKAPSQTVEQGSQPSVSEGVMDTGEI